MSKDSVRGREMTCSIEALRVRKLDIGGQIIRRIKGTTKDGANEE